MPLSRLDNFLKNVRGNIIYVDPNSLDATDSITNQGNSAARPFITIQRALIEAARFSYQRGLDNDRFEKTTVLLAPGDHVIDNRPGWIPNGSNNFLLRNGNSSDDFSEFSSTTNFNIEDENNALYKLNSIYGGVVVPRGVSIVGQDLRKCKIRPKYVPNPENDSITSSAIFRVTGGCYLQSFTIKDASLTDSIFKDYTTNTFTPNFSHHKLTAFEYCDGANATNIADDFIGSFYTSRSDLDMYYEKIGLAYGPSSGREITPDYPNSGVDIEPKIDEYRIVGPTSGSVGISSIKAGDGSTTSTTITVTLESGLEGLDVDTRIIVSGIAEPRYDGTFLVNEVVTQNSDGNTTVFKYEVPVAPVDALPSTTGGSVSLSTDTVSSASPYIFNVSMRSVYGMCGMHADGSKADGFKSMVVAQFTGVSLQVDDNAFVRFNETTGAYDDSTSVNNLHTDPRSKYKPAYNNYHIKASNNSFIQLVSIFAIGFSRQFVVESGGDFSVTNSNSNFGQTALYADGFRDTAFTKDDVGYITNIIPPKAIAPTTVNLEYDAIDVTRTVGVGSTSRLYLYNRTNQDSAPSSVLQGYRIGAKTNDRLQVVIPQGGTSTEYYARIVMPDTEEGSSQVTSVKTSTVGRSVGSGNSISGSVVTLKEDHQLINGETIRFFSDNGRLPDGLESNRLYYAITNGVNADQIKVALTLNDAQAGNNITFNNLGGNLNVESRVSDKTAGDIGHPIQYDSAVNQWFVTVGTAATDNSLYPTIVGLGTTALGDSTSRTYISRTPDTRDSEDRIYKLRYVIPAGSGITSARPPVDSFILQESDDVSGASNTEVALQYSPSSVTMSNVTEMRNFRFISRADWSGGTAYYTTEQPHQLSIGSTVSISNVTSANFPTGAGNSGFNGTFKVTGINSARQFYVDGVSENPGAYTNNVDSRTTSLPTFTRKTSKNNYVLQNVQQIREYIPAEQDGIYYLTILNSSNQPSVAPFNQKGYNFGQPKQNIYPQFDRDNPLANPNSASSFAVSDTIGQVVVDRVKSSITRESLDLMNVDFGVGLGITNIVSSATGTAHTIYTDRDHGLNGVAAVTITTAGSAYGNGTGGVENLYNATLVNSNTGANALARITVNASGEMTAVKIIDGGCNYAVGDVLTVTGTATTTGHSAGTVTVSQIRSNIGDTISLAGVSSALYSDYNQLYRITGISTTKEVEVASVDVVPNGSVLGTGSTDLANASIRLTGPALDISSIEYNGTTGIATVKTVQAHGLRAHNSIRIGGASESFYNKEFIVTQNVGLTTFQVNIGVSTLSPTASGTLRGYYTDLSAQDGAVRIVDENFGGRGKDVYAGISTVLSAEVTSTTTDEISISNVGNFNFNIGDYLRIDDEIVRIKTTVGSNPVEVFRGIFGTIPATHASGSVVRKIHVSPVELRRHSIARASGHTFEYVGYGPGNYSTAFPDKQSEQLTLAQQLIAQSTISAGGVNVYTGMNDRGDFFSGNRRIVANSGKEEVFETPIQSYTGEDIFSAGVTDSGIDAIAPSEANITRAIRVGGGQDNNILSEFNGPVVFSEKLTSTSAEGIEANSLFLQGDATVSRNYTVGISTPTDSGNPGDIVFNANPVKAGTIGWTYTTDKGWYPFGGISLDQNSKVFIFDKVGVGTTTPGTDTFKVGAGSSQFSVNGSGEVGIGTTANGFQLRVEGGIRANSFTGDGSGLVNLVNDSLWAGVAAGLGTGLYPIDNLNVGIGTTFPDNNYSLDVGTAGVGGTDLRVQNQSQFVGTVKITSAEVTGIITALNYDLDNSTNGRINAGVVTSTTLRVGTAGTILSATSGVGIGTSSPRAALDVEGAARLKSYYEMPLDLSISSNVVEVDLNKAQTFELTLTDDVTRFTLINPPPTNGSTAFTIKILQDSTGGRGVGIDTFRNAAGIGVTVYWPGGVVPVVTTTADKTDIYSFMTFDGGATLYGVVGGQNFS